MEYVTLILIFIIVSYVRKLTSVFRLRFRQEFLFIYLFGGMGGEDHERWVPTEKIH